MASDGTMNESLLKNLDKTLQNINDKLTTMANSISQVGQNWSVAAKTAAEFTEQIRAIGRAQNELLTTKYNDLFGLDAAKVKTSELRAEIKKLKGDLESGTEGAVRWNAKSGSYKYVKGDKELSPEDQISKQERLNGLKKIAADLDKGQAQAAIDLLNAIAKQQSAEEKELLNLIKLRNRYKETIASSMSEYRVSVKRHDGEETPFDKRNVAFAKQRAQEIAALNQQIEEQRKKANITTNAEIEREELRHQEKMNQIRRQEQKGLIGQQSINPVWNEMMARSNEREQAIAKATDGYIQKQQKLDELYAKLEQQQAKLQGQRERGIAESAQKRTQTEIAKTEASIKRAEQAQQKFVSTLLSTEQGRVALAALRNELGQVQSEEQKTATVFDRVIADINAKAERQKGQFAKKIIDAEGVRDEAKRALSEIIKQFTTPLRGVLAQKQSVDLSVLSSSARKRYQREIQNVRSSTTIKSSENPAAYEALKRYYDTLRAIEELEARRTQANNKYKAQESAIQGVTRRYQENEQAIQRVKERWDELNVKHQAKLINDADFKKSTDNIIAEYDRLIKKRQEFEIQDLGQLSQQREQERLDAQNRAAKKQAAAAKGRLDAVKRTNKQEARTLREQITLNRQITSLWGQYRKRLDATPKDKRADDKSLNDARKKLRELIALAKEYERVMPGSKKIASQYLAYDKLTKKLKEENELHDKTRDKLNSLVSIANKFASAFGIALSAQSLVQFGKKIVEVTGKFEEQQVALRAIIQNKQVADQLWEQTLAQALQSPFTAMQLTRYTKQLAAYRIENDKLFDSTKRLADVSAGLGVDMDRLILAYGQVKTANFLRASEVRQFTEAGVNIYGELAELFTKMKQNLNDLPSDKLTKYLGNLKKQTVGVADVVDMVSKRLVSFQQVEEVFKNLTSEGGTFYDMQYKQSQTVRGQINKLHDAYDQLLAKVGGSSKGTIRFLIATLLKMVQSFRTLRGILIALPTAALINGIITYTRQLRHAELQTESFRKKQELLGKTWGKLKQQFGTGAGWLSIGITAGVTALTMFINRLAAVKEINREIMDTNIRLYETEATMTRYSDKIEENNRVLKDSTASHEDQKSAMEDNQRVIASLQKDYPEIARQLSITENGYIANVNALHKYNKELEDQITLNALGKSSFGLKSHKEHAQDLTADVMKADAVAREYFYKKKTKAAELIRSGKYSEEENEVLRLIAGLNIEDVRKAEEELNGLADALFSVSKNAVSRASAFQQLGFRMFPRNDGGGWYGTSGFVGFSSLVDKNDVKDVKGDIKEGLSVYWDEISQAIANDYKKELDEFEKSPEYEKIKESNPAKLLIEAFAYVNKEKIKKDAEEGKNSVFKFTKEYLGQYYGSKLAQDEVNRIFNTISGWNPFAGLDFDVFAYQGKDDPYNSIFGDDNKNKAPQRRNLSELMNVIERMKHRYDELAESAYGVAKAEAKVREEFKKAYEEAGKSLGKELPDFNAYLFATEEEVAKWEEALADAVKKVGESKFVENTVAHLLAKASENRVRIGINIEAAKRDTFTREMEDLLSGYQLSMELQKMNISADAAKDLVGIDYTYLNDLQEKITEWREKMVPTPEGNLDKKDVELYLKYAKKIEEEIFKMRKARAEQYSKFLEKELSERARLEMQYASDLAFVRANEKAYESEGGADAIIKGIDDKYKKDLNELEWKAFKESDFYMDMMQDLSNLPVVYLDELKKQLDVWIEKSSELTPRAFKEILKAQQQIIQARIALNPLAVMSDSISSIKQSAKRNNVNPVLQFRKAQTKVSEEVIQNEESIRKQKEEINQRDILIGKLKRQKELEEELAKITPTLGNVNVSSIDELQRKLEEARAALEKINKNRPSAFNIGVAGGYKSTEEYNTATEQWTERRGVQEGYVNALDMALKLQKEMTELGLTEEQKAINYNQLLSERNKMESSLAELLKKQAKLREDEAAYDNFIKAAKQYASNVKTTGDEVKNAMSTSYSAMKALGAETDILTDEWAKFGGTIVDTVTQALTMIPLMVAGFTAAGIAINSALGIIGLIAEAISLVMGLLQGLAQLHDAGIQKELNKSKERVDELTKAYDRLTKAIKRTLSTSSYIGNYNQQLANLNEQLAEANAQERAAQDIKDADKRKEEIEGAKSAREEIIEQIDEIKQALREDFGGIGEDNYRSWTEGFVTAWRDAFLETGDGLDALEDHFDEFLKDWFVKQATMRIAGNALKPLMERIDRAVDADGNVYYEELQSVKAQAAKILPKLSQELTDFAGSWGLEGNGSLSGLAAGIQGITEEQANVLESYWNSVRMYTASIDMNVAAIASALGIGDGAGANPMLSQLQLIAGNTRSINTLLGSVVKSGHNLGGVGIKVFNN